MRYAESVPLLLCLAMTLALATGCIYEDRSKCVNTILLSYTGDGNTEIFNEKIGELDLYIFDDNHRCVLTRALTERELENRKAQVMLMPGETYHAVCVGNAGDAVTVNLHEGTIADTRLCHCDMVEDEHAHVDSHDHLYQGGATMVVPAGGKSIHTVAMNASHIDMIVEVTGYNESGFGTRVEDGHPLDLEHKNLPSWVDFTNNHSKRRPDYDREQDLMSHHPRARVEDGKYIFEYNVMRDLSGTMIHLYDSNGDEIKMPGLPIDVEAYIDEHLVPNADIEGPYGADGELLQEAPIPIKIEFTNIEVVVSIPEWAVTPTTPEF